MRNIDTIVVHCSDSLWGNSEVIDGWHRQRGWKEIGYHYVIGNGYPTLLSFKNKFPEVELDGKVESGRNLKIPGAHVRGHNFTSIGICLIGKQTFTSKQIASLLSLIGAIVETKNLCPDGVQVFGHHELDKKKSCPNLDMHKIRDLV